MPKPVYALVGGETLLQTEALKKILAELPPDAQRIDVDGERAQLADVLDELRSFAMFGGLKVVVVGSADDFISRFREPLETYCAQPTDSAVLILRAETMATNTRIYKSIVKTGLVIACAPPKDGEIAGWIAQRARSAHQLTLTPQATAMLKDLLGAELGRIDSELGKLALQCPGGKVDAKDIAGSVAFQREQEMWNLTDEIAAGNVAAAIRRWRQLIQMDNSTEFRAVTWLGIWVEKSIRAMDLKARGADVGRIGSELKIWPRDKAVGFLRTAEQLGREGLYRALTMLVEIDRQSKSGIGNAADNVERFILSVGTWLGAGGRV